MTNNIEFEIKEIPDADWDLNEAPCASIFTNAEDILDPDDIVIVDQAIDLNVDDGQWTEEPYVVNLRSASEQGWTRVELFSAIKTLVHELLGDREVDHIYLETFTYNPDTKTLEIFVGS